MGATVGGVTETGGAFVEAIERRDFDRLEALFAPEVRFRALTPRREPVARTAAGARAVVEGWFAGADAIDEVACTIDEVADRVHLAYRLRVREEGVWKLVEQQAFASIEAGRIADMALVCSGFRPMTGGAVPEASARLDAQGEDCATLTPRIREVISELPSGEVLEVISDDPAAEDGLRAWSRLTGHELLAVGAATGAEPQRFYLRRR